MGASEKVELKSSAPIDKSIAGKPYPKAYFTEGSREYYCRDMKLAPLGTKLICKTLGGNAVFAVLSSRNLDGFLAWARLPVDAPEDKGKDFNDVQKVLEKMRNNMGKVNLTE